MAPCLTPKPDTLRATEPDISFAPNSLRASPCLSLALYGIIATCFLMIAQFYLNRD
jgi:hypothetical protein